MAFLVLKEKEEIMVDDWGSEIYMCMCSFLETYTHKSRMSKMVYLQRVEGGSGRSVWRIGNKVTWNEKERFL